MNARIPTMRVRTRGFTRREFLGASALGSAALLGGGWSAGLGAAPRRGLGFSGDGESWMDATIPQLQAMMQTGQLTSRALTQGYLARIASLNPLLHAVIETNP